jgi:hypothetical protein
MRDAACLNESHLGTEYHSLSIKQNLRFINEGRSAVNSWKELMGVISSKSDALKEAA